MKWEAVNFQDKTLAINHKIIEAKVDGKFVPMGEDVLKNKASIRMLLLLPVIEKLLLQQKEKQEFMQDILKTGYCTEYLEYICVDQTGKLLRSNFVSDHFYLFDKEIWIKKDTFSRLTAYLRQSVIG